MDGERWDREITLTPGRDWLVVEGLAGRVGRGAAALSLKLETVALGTILSLDLLELSLCQYGRVIDVYASDPSLLVGLSATKRKEHAGHPQRWKPFLQLPNAPRDLRAAWLEAATLTDKLASAASMLGVERPQLDAQGTAARRLRYAQREEPL